MLQNLALHSLEFHIYAINIKMEKKCEAQLRMKIALHHNYTSLVLAADGSS